MKLARMLRHLIAPHWLVRRAFPAATLDAIEAAVAAVEQRHAGELRFVVEAGLPLSSLWHEVSARARAIEVFSRLRVWDTEHNSGVLVYVQLIDRRVEIVADRGINARVEQTQWDAICRGMETKFREGDYARGALQAVDNIGRLLADKFPALPEGRGMATNELPDRPVLL
ncbi:MAG: TPM domain-containing protein [Sterolibacterium sp.]|nr:TPM domain-containing protein [Sterolibacterium sp.]